MHYENVPFEIPESWEWIPLTSICSFLSRGKSPKYADEIKKYPVFAQKCNLYNGDISLEKARFLDPNTLSKWSDDYKLRDGDVLVNSTGTGTVGRTRLFHSDVLGEYPFVVPDSHVSVIRTFEEIASRYVYAYLLSNYAQKYFEDNLAGSTNQRELYIDVLENLRFPLPPLKEQNRIVAEISKWFSIIDGIDQYKSDLHNYVKQTKSKILSLAISGKLVPQDPNDEPAIELLKRINPDFVPCDTSHYGNLPGCWHIATLKDVSKSISIRDYQIQQKTIQSEGNYPVVSQSSNYIEGYCNNSEKIYHHKAPVIVFGDHTRIVKFIDFDFVVGADGVKVLKPLINAKYLYYLTQYASEKIKDRGYGRHYGYLSNFKIPIPPLKEQDRIVDKIDHINSIIEEIGAEL